MQIQADLLGVDIVRPDMVETTALGAARLAARAIGTQAGESEGTRVTTLPAKNLARTRPAPHWRAGRQAVAKA